MPGVEVRGNHLRVAHDNLGAEHPVQAAPQACRVDVAVDRDTDHLTPRVHAGVGAPGAAELDGAAQHAGQRLAEHPFDRAFPGLRCEAVELGAVVRDDELERCAPDAPLDRSVEWQLAQTSSTRAMGALSPGRGPSFRMRR